MTIQMLNVTALQKMLNRFANDRDWEQFHSPKNLAMALAVEAGEIMEIFQWFTDEESRGVVNNPEVKAKVREEIADVLLYLLKLADKLEIDLESACRDKLEVNERKYPAAKAKGSAAKYTAYLNDSGE